MSAIQGSAEWLAERAGFCTASRAADVQAKIKSGEASSRRKYRMQLVTERLTGIPAQSYQNTAMIWGTETEPLAREAFEAERGVIVEQTGFCKHPVMEWVGASPDGLIDSDGLIEIKCPESTTHVEWMEQSRVPPEHVPQIQFQLWTLERKWCEFVSFDPRFPPHLQLFTVHVERDDAYIDTLRLEVVRFLQECQELYNKLMGTK